MKAIVYFRFGKPDVLECLDIEDPLPRAGELLVRVQAAGLNPKDSLIRKGKFALLSGRRFPKMLGYDFAGTVAALPPHSRTDLQVGQSVFGMKNGFAGSTIAEVVRVPLTEVVATPEGLGFEEAAALPLVCLTALQALRPALARSRPELAGSPRVLLHGASGGVGQHAIQVAKYLGAHVTTTSSAANLELCRSRGADETLDYRSDSGLSEASRYDVIFDIFGNRSFEQAREALRPRGTYISTVPSFRIFLDWLLTLRGSKRARLVIVNSNQADLRLLAQAASKGEIRGVVDRVYSLTQTAEAQTYIETRRARGKVIISLLDSVSDDSSLTEELTKR